MKNYFSSKTLCLLVFLSFFIFGCTTDEVTQNTELKEFNDSELGLSFEYNPVSRSGQSITVEVDGDQIIISEENDLDENDTYRIEILDRIGETPEDSVKAYIAGEDAKYCSVQVLGDNNFVIGTDLELSEMRERETGRTDDLDCGPYYQIDFGVVFKFLDSAPSRLLIIRLSENPFMADTDWDNKIELVDSESDFNFIYGYGTVNGRAMNELNTFNDTFTQDMVVEDPFTGPMELSDDEMLMIQNEIKGLDLSGGKAPLAGGIIEMMTPCSEYSLKVGIEDEITWDDCSGMTDDQAEFVDFMIRLIDSQEEFQDFPEPQGAYL